VNYSSSIPSERWNDIERKKIHLLKKFKTWLLISAAVFLAAVSLYLITILVLQLALFIPDTNSAKVMFDFTQNIMFPIADAITWVSFCLPVVSLAYLIAYAYAKHQQRFS
jgi:hypothetical protein